MERVFRELRRVLKWKSFPRLEVMVLLIEHTLRRWNANPAFIQQLAGWDWIGEALNALGPNRETELVA